MRAEAPTRLKRREAELRGAEPRGAEPRGADALRLPPLPRGLLVLPLRGPEFRVPLLRGAAGRGPDGRAVPSARRAGGRCEEEFAPGRPVPALGPAGLRPPKERSGRLPELAESLDLRANPAGLSDFWKRPEAAAGRAVREAGLDGCADPAEAPAGRRRASVAGRLLPVE